MNKKLTDKEIKKALEWHLNEVNHCDECPLFVLKNTTTYCVDVLMQNSLDLINRLEGEKEKNENIIRVADKTIATLNAENENLKAEVERLKKHIQEGIDLAKQIPEMLALAKAKAYKEFDNLLDEKFAIIKTKLPNNELVEKPIQICQNIIRITLKELVGEDK